VPRSRSVNLLDKLTFGLLKIALARDARRGAWDVLHRTHRCGCLLHQVVRDKFQGRPRSGIARKFKTDRVPPLFRLVFDIRHDHARSG